MAETTTAPSAASTPRPQWQRELVAFAELFVLSGVAIAQPLLQIFAADVDAFVRADASGADVLTWALLVTFLPAVVLWSIELLVGMVGMRARQVVHTAMIAALGLAFVLRAVRDIAGIDRWFLLIVGLGVTAGLVHLYRRSEAARQWLLYVSWMPLMFLGLFYLGDAGTYIRGGQTTGPESAQSAEGGPGRVITAEDLEFDSDTEVSAIGTVDSDTPVVMLVMDALPTTSLLDGDGAIDRDLYPNFARLADMSTWYRNSTTVAPFSTKAVPSILTGNEPPTRVAAATVDEYPTNLFTLMGGSYDLVVNESLTRLCPVNLCPDANPGGVSGLSALLEDSIQIWPKAVSPFDPGGVDFNVAGDERTAEFQTWLEEIRGGRTLSYEHVVMPHAPWQFVPSGNSYEAPSPDEGVLFGVWTDDTAALIGKQRYILQLQATDRMVGQLLDRMETLGILDEAVLVVTADHGGSFRGQEGERLVSEGNQADIAWQALFIKAPGQTEGRVDDSQVTSMDILPTIAELVGFTVPGGTDGLSIVDGTDRDEAVRPLLDWAQNTVEPGPDDFLAVDAGLFESDVLTQSAVPSDVVRDEYAVYRLGPYGSVVGSDAAGFDTGEVVGGSVDDAGRYESVVIGPGEKLPLYVTGSVGPTQESWLAVSVNGTVAVTAPLLGDGEIKDFRIVIPDWLLREGSNDIGLLIVGGDPGSPTITPVVTG